jgi:hypothetical protein
MATLLAAAAPAIALAASQHPADSARAHPASSAHANATAGADGAARIEGCSNAAAIMLDTLEKGDAKGATSDFDATMKANLGADKLTAVWQHVESQMGKLQTLGTPQNMLYRGRVIITRPLHFEKGDLDAQVACDADGKIAGFFLRRGASPASAPASSD